MRHILQLARANAGKTQKETAQSAGISERMYQKIEAGKSKPNVETAIFIAEFLGSPVEKLFSPREDYNPEDEEETD